jgi:signal transduction histidine kinase
MLMPSPSNTALTMADRPPVHPLVEAELTRLLTRAVTVRAWVAPVISCFALAVAVYDPTPWRRALMLTVIAVVNALAMWAAWRLRGRPLTVGEVHVNAVGMALFQFTMILGTGGLESPLLPIAIPFAVLAAVGVPNRHTVQLVVGLQIGLLWLLAALQSTGWLSGLPVAGFEPGPDRGAYLLGVTFVVSVALIAGGVAGRLFRDRLEGLVTDVVDARDAELQTLVAHSRELEAVGGEIAHELKNPLASIKGLAALLARDVSGDRSAERLAVLRSEVDRMQGILDEFLTWSRPIAPLTASGVDLRALCTRVAAMHEGMALQRGVRLVVQGTASELRGDARKLLQILVNLVQNALDASPSGSEILLDVRPVGGGVHVEVCDRGEGLPDALRDQLFDAGVTTKAHGTGLGLPIARALARQHGGDLTLQPRSGGGTVARLTVRHLEAT